jgi:hypothetical protein
MPLAMQTGLSLFGDWQAASDESPAASQKMVKTANFEAVWWV